MRHGVTFHCAKNEMTLPRYVFHNQAKVIRKYSKIHMQLIYLNGKKMIIITQ